MYPVSIVPIVKAMLEDVYTTNKMLTWAVTLADPSKPTQEAATQAVATLGTLWGEVLTPMVVARPMLVRCGGSCAATANSSTSTPYAASRRGQNRGGHLWPPVRA
jgi:hypothetical protein